jgi:4-amino-4-deoxy-L-arabinose transferase-like glycosyltransferase
MSFWRSPEDQPAWARPALLGLAAVAAFAYAWGMNSANLEVFYGAAVRSMAGNWHDFFFAAFDPWGTVSVDKLPGALWLEALSVRIFGFHIWAFVLPQVIEGTLTVLVLYRTVRRVAGPGAGLVAAGILAITPATVLLNRGNVSDTLLILLLVLAVDATQRAIASGRWQTLALAGLYVGLAFQAKMLQAWIVLPALYLAYLLAGPTADLVRRCTHVVLSGVVVLIVSLSWMTAVSVVPSHDRPYVDGSCNNSIYSQVFLYNGTDRLSGHVLTQAGCRPASPQLATTESHLPVEVVGHLSKGLGRFLTGGFGRLAAWLFPPSLVAIIGLLIETRRRPRTDARRAAVVMWTIWLFFTWEFFSDSHQLNSYYLAALIPPIAALCGMGLAAAWSHRDSRRVRTTVLLTVAGGTAYAASLVPGSAGVALWAWVSSGTLALAAIVLLALAHRPALARWSVPAGFTLGALALAAGPAWASAASVRDQLSPFETPYQPASLTATLAQQNAGALASIPALQAEADRVPANQAVNTIESSQADSFYVLATGREWLPVGGFTGQIPEPSLSQFEAYVRAGKVVQVTVAMKPRTTNPDLLWVAAHCTASTTKGTFVLEGVHFARYRCSRADAP